MAGGGVQKVVFTIVKQFKVMGNFQNYDKLHGLEAPFSNDGLDAQWLAHLQRC